jgi:GT2 family glycosyltransferase
MKPKISCIVLSYNGIELTLQCLSSLLEQDYTPLEIIVVDNASQDETVSTIQTQFPEIHLIASKTNLGYTAGNNLGIKAALENGADFVFLVNNDTLLEPDCVTKLMDVFNNKPNVGIAGPMVYTFDAGEIISSAGGAIDWIKADSINIGAGEEDKNQYPERDVDFINGCGLAVRKQVIQQIGGLDEAYFMYWEETDWCTRAKQAGWEVLFAPTALMRHKAPIDPGVLSPVTIYYMTRNRLRFFALHTPWPRKILTLAYALNGIFHGLWHSHRLGRTEHTKALRAALLDSLQRRWGYVAPSNWLSPQS